MTRVVVITNRRDFHQRFTLFEPAKLSERCQQEPVAWSMVGILPHRLPAYLGCLLIVALEIVGHGKFQKSEWLDWDRADLI